MLILRIEWYFSRIIPAISILGADTVFGICIFVKLFMPKKTIIPIYDLYKTLDSSLGFEFCKLEEAYNPYDATLPHRHNYYEILFFNESGGNHEIDFISYPVHANSLHFIAPEQVHLLRRDKNTTGYVVSFSKDFCYEETAGRSFIDHFPFFNNSFSSPIVRLNSDEQAKNISDIITKIQKEYFSDSEDKANVLSSYLTILLVTAKRLYVPQNREGKVMPVRSELTQKFKTAVEENFITIKSVNEYAKLLNISSGHLNDTVHHDIGKTASEIIHERIILEAKRFLYRSEKSVKEIAYALGYEDPSYFVKFFKTHTEVTPELFRNQIREKYR
jgi:AraC family transcriptional regulator, transcriptional activator of pobA